MYKNLTTKQIKELVRQPYAWPGGYEVIFITNDGACLCHDCVRKEWQYVCWSVRNQVNDGWQVVGFATLDNDIESTDESPLYCEHCNKEWEPN